MGDLGVSARALNREPYKYGRNVGTSTVNTPKNIKLDVVGFRRSAINNLPSFPCQLPKLDAGFDSPLPASFQPFTFGFEPKGARENGVTTGLALRNCIINKDAATIPTLAFKV
jgi:hypothetical protein